MVERGIDRPVPIGFEVDPHDQLVCLRLLHDAFPLWAKEGASRGPSRRHPARNRSAHDFASRHELRIHFVHERR